MRDLLGFLSGLAVIAVVWGLLVLLKRWQRRGRPAEPVESNLPRVHREPMTEIDAVHGKDYRGPGRAGEPMFPPGALLGLLALIATFVGGALYSHYGRAFLEPIVDPIVRAIFPTSR